MDGWVCLKCEMTSNFELNLQSHLMQAKCIVMAWSRSEEVLEIVLEQNLHFTVADMFATLTNFTN